jgi:hypothetical protein
MQRFSKCLIVAMLTLSLGLHWALLQTVGWAGMVWQYSKDASLSVALAKTFDGQHPCQICKIVTEGQNSEKKQEAQQPLVKLEFSLASAPVVLYPPAIHSTISLPADLADSRSYLPPTPPPRALHG